MSNNTKGEVKEREQADIIDMPSITGETTGVQEQRIPLTDSMKRTLLSLFTERSEIDAALNDLVRMIATQAGVNRAEFKLDMAVGVIIAQVPAAEKKDIGN